MIRLLGTDKKALKKIVGSSFTDVKIKDFYFEFEEDNNYDDLGTYRIAITFEDLTGYPIGEETLGGFHLAPMPNCCGIVIYTKPYIEVDLCKTDKIAFSQLLQNFAKRQAKSGGYSKLIYTQITSAFVEIAAAELNEWELIKSFQNRRTHNKINVYMTTIPR